MGRASVPPSREAAKQETRDALVLAGMAEFAEHGLDAPSLDRICARAGYTRGAFYVHFRDRDDFVVAVMEHVLRAFLDGIIATGDEASDLEQTVRRFTSALDLQARGETIALPGLPAPPASGGLQLHRLLEAGARSPDLRERFARLLEEAIARVGRATAEGQAAGSVRADADSEQIGTVLVALALGALTALETGIRFDPKRAGESVLALLRAR